MAKFHEILLTASLSAIVLQRIRNDIIHTTGIPLGFLSSGYQLNSFSYLFSKEFLGGLIKGFRTQQQSWLPLYILVPFCFVLTAVVGPASAIALLPKLNWWPVHDPLNGTYISTFYPLGENELWPTTIDASLLSSPAVLPASYSNCSSDIAYQDPSCPSGGTEVILKWATSYMDEEQAPNITISDPAANLNRYLSSSYYNKQDGWAVTSTVGARQTRDFGTFWQWLGTSTKLAVTTMGRPKFSPSLGQSTQIQKPIVETQCAQYVMGDPNIAFQTDKLSFNNDVGNNGSWVIPSAVSALIKPPAQDNIEVIFRWVDMSIYKPTLSSLIGAVFISTDVDNQTAIYPCTIAAYYTPVDIWYDPMSAGTVAQDTPDPLGVVSRVTSMSKSQQSEWIVPITIDPTWLDSVNLPNYGPSWTGRQNLTILEEGASKFGFEGSNLTWRLGPAGAHTDVPWLFATVLSMQLTDGLARVNFGYPTLGFMEYTPNSNNHTGRLKNLDDVNNAAWAGAPLGAPSVQADYGETARTSNATHNTEVFWHVDRFGYGWGFNSSNEVTLALGALILLVHAAIALAHMVNLMISDAYTHARTMGNWKSMGEMIVLAVGSREPPDGSLDNTSAGVGSMQTWGTVVRVRDRAVKEPNSPPKEISDTAYYGRGLVSSNGVDEEVPEPELEPEKRRLQLVFGLPSTDAESEEERALRIGKRYN